VEYLKAVKKRQPRLLAISDKERPVKGKDHIITSVVMKPDIVCNYKGFNQHKNKQNCENIATGTYYYSYLRLGKLVTQTKYICSGCRELVKTRLTMFKVNFKEV
jgi:hypothetical protein